MQDRKLYEQLLAIHRPWRVRDVELQPDEGDVMVFVEHASGERLVCPTCGGASPGYDTRQRRWRHLDTMQHRTVIVADVPRVRCATHGVVQCKVAWADEGSRSKVYTPSSARMWIWTLRSSHDD
jgi:transposase